MVDQEQVAVASSDLRLADFAEQWLAERPLKPRTRETYEGQYRLHIKPMLGDARLARIRPQHIRTWHADLSTGTLSPVTVAKVYRLLRTILGTAVDDGHLQQNPCQIAGGGVERSAERTIPTLDVVAEVSDALPERFAVVPWVAALAGLRKGEILGLARSHVDLGRSVIQVERALQELTGQGVHFVSPKSDASRRTVTIPDLLCTRLEDHLAAFVEASPSALVFTNAHGRPVRATVWSKAWGDARRSIEQPDLRLHDLRHLAGTLATQAGATLKETMARLGHSTPAAALRYQHVVESRQHAVAKMIDEMIDRG